VEEDEWDETDNIDRGVQYCVEIHNRCGKTIQGVHALVDFGFYSRPLVFSRTKAKQIDLHPSSREMIDLYFISHTPVDLSFLGEKDISKPIDFTLLIRGKDMHEISKKFICDRTKVPAIRPL
jgi:hypothetical protein